MAQAGIAPDCEVGLQEIWWMAREAQRRELARWRHAEAVMGGSKEALREVLEDEED